MRAKTWIAREIANFIAQRASPVDSPAAGTIGGTRDLLGQRDGPTDKGINSVVNLTVTVPGGMPGGSIASWRRVARQLSGYGTSASASAGGATRASVGAAAAAGGRIDDGDAMDANGGGDNDEAAAEAAKTAAAAASTAEYDLLLTAYAQSVEGWDDPEFPVDRPVFSSPMVQAMIPAPEGPHQSMLLYRPWFFNLKDLTETLQRAMEAEARRRAARNKNRREKLVRTLAQMLTAFGNTKGNPQLGGWSIPGLEGRNKGGGGGMAVNGGSRGGGGGLLGGSGDDGGDAGDGGDEGDGDDGRRALTPGGCQIGAMYHTDCHQLNHVLTAK
jgi:hypothetical protein